MTAARTARITVEVSFTISDQATEGEMVDAVQSAVLAATPALNAHRAICKARILATHVSLIGEPGGSL